MGLALTQSCLPAGAPAARGTSAIDVVLDAGRVAPVLVLRGIRERLVD